MSEDNDGVLDSPDQPVPTAEQEAQLLEIAGNFLRQLESGEKPDSAAIIAAHSHLAPFLEQRLAFLLEVHRLKSLPREEAGQSPATVESQAESSGFQSSAPSPDAADLEPTRSLHGSSPRWFPPEHARHITCPHCGNGIQLVEQELAEITCKNCGSTFHVDTGADLAPTIPFTIRQVGRFQIVDTLGRGGFGVVYKARDPELNRFVAIKIPRAGYFVSAEDEERFMREARHAANLRHAGIVRVYEVARESQIPYIVTEYIDGLTLADQLTLRRLSQREIAELVAQVADALNYAHENRVIHRDVKPSNILLDHSGRPYVADFGLARRDDVEVTITIQGEILGTPTYMSPEQAVGEQEKIDRRTDVYSLGVVLYRALTGELPFRGTRRMLVHQILYEEPKPLRRINDVIPRDLETITLKAMAKEPGRRYASARELADDLRRWLNREPILARPIGYVERGIRWCRRKPVVASLIGAVATMLLATAILATVWAIRERVLHHRTELARQGEAAERKRADENALASRRRLSQFLEAQGVESIRKNDVLGALPWLVESLALEDAGGERDRLQRIRLGTILRSAPRLTQCFSLTGELRAAALSPSGDYAAAGGTDGNVVVIRLGKPGTLANAPRHAAGVSAVAFRPDSQAVATASYDKSARLWNFASEPPVIHSLLHEESVHDVVFAPDGKLLATASTDKTVRLWNSATGQQDGEPLRHGFPVHHIRFSADGTRLWSVQWNRQNRESSIMTWDVKTRSLIGSPMVHPRFALDIQVSPNGDRIVTAGFAGHVHLWQPQDFTPVDAVLHHEGVVRSVRFTPDGSNFYTVDESGQVSFFEAKTGAMSDARIANNGPLISAIVSHHGQFVATAGADGVTRIWDRAKARVISSELRHGDAVRAVAFTPDDRSLMTSAGDGIVKIWDIANLAQTESPARHEKVILRIAVSASGKRFVTASGDNTARLWESEGRRLVQSLPHAAEVLDCSISPDERWVATASFDGSARLWKYSDGTPILEPLIHSAPLNHLAFSPDSSKLATSCEDGKVRLWDTANGQLLRVMEHTANARAVTFSPSGQYLASSGDDRTTRVWNVSDGQPAGPPLPHQGSVRTCAFSRDGLLLVTGADDAQTVVWDWKSGKPVDKLPQHQSAVRKVGFSSHENLVLSVGQEETAMLRNLAQRQTATRLVHHNASLGTGRFSPDGKFVVIVGGDAGRAGSIRQSGDGFAMLWDVTSGIPLSPALRHQHDVTDTAFISGGRELLTVTKSGEIRAWSLAPDNRPINELRREARLLSGFGIDSSHGLIPVPAAEQEHDFGQREASPSPVAVLSK